MILFSENMTNDEKNLILENENKYLNNCIATFKAQKSTLLLCMNQITLTVDKITSVGDSDLVDKTLADLKDVLEKMHFNEDNYSKLRSILRKIYINDSKTYQYIDEYNTLLTSLQDQLNENSLKFESFIKDTLWNSEFVFNNQSIQIENQTDKEPEVIASIEEPIPEQPIIPEKPKKVKTKTKSKNKVKKASKKNKKIDDVLSIEHIPIIDITENIDETYIKNTSEEKIETEKIPDIESEPETQNDDLDDQKTTVSPDTEIDNEQENENNSDDGIENNSSSDTNDKTEDEIENDDVSETNNVIEEVVEDDDVSETNNIAEEELENDDVEISEEDFDETQTDNETEENEANSDLTEEILDTELTDNNCLLISEKENKVFLPYKLVDLQTQLLSKNNQYKNIQELIEKEYILPLEQFKSPTLSRFREAYHLMKNKENSSFLEAISLALELSFNSVLNPAVIAACKNQDELDIYLDCLYENELDKFNIFEIKYDIAPMKN